jgi:hypothetical protein
VKRALSVALPTERQVQREILRMAGTCFRDVFIHHSPNGTKLPGSERDRQVAGGILRGDGMKAGFPDLIILWAPGKGCFIEVKRPKNFQISDVQKAMHERLDELGWPVATVTSPEAAYRFLKECGAPCSGQLMVAA